jgi:hypothetical protein
MLAARAAVITNAACEVPCDRPGELGEGADPEDRAVVADGSGPTERR